MGEGASQCGMCVRARALRLAAFNGLSLLFFLFTRFHQIYKQTTLTMVVLPINCGYTQKHFIEYLRMVGALIIDRIQCCEHSADQLPQCVHKILIVRSMQTNTVGLMVCCCCYCRSLFNSFKKEIMHMFSAYINTTEHLITLNTY